MKNIISPVTLTATARKLMCCGMMSMCIMPSRMR